MVHDEANSVVYLLYLRFVFWYLNSFSLCIIKFNYIYIVLLTASCYAPATGLVVVTLPEPYQLIKDDNIILVLDHQHQLHLCNFLIIIFFMSPVQIPISGWRSLININNLFRFAN